MIKVEKVEEQSQTNFSVLISDEKNQKFEIGYGGCDIYWTMLNYSPENLIVITKEDGFLFSLIESLFANIKKCDYDYDSLLKGNCFTWKSEAYGLPEDAHKLEIIKNNDNYTIKFYQNPNYSCNIKNICAICFCLSGSRNKDIAFLFSTMFMELQKYLFENTQVRTLKK